MSSTETQQQPYVFDAVPVDVLMSVGAVVRQQWGDYGYSINIAQAGFGSYLFGVRHSDGSEFYLSADRCSNVYQAVWNGETFDRGERL